MGYILIKFFVSATVLVLVSELAKRSSLLGAVLASLPLVSLMAMMWLYIDTKNTQAVVALAKDIFWMVLPAQVFFIVFPLLMRYKMPFYTALIVAGGVMVLSYLLMIFLFRKLGIIRF